MAFGLPLYKGMVQPNWNADNSYPIGENADAHERYRGAPRPVLAADIAYTLRQLLDCRTVDLADEIVLGEIVVPVLLTKVRT